MHPHVIRIDDVRLLHLIVILSARRDEANVVADTNPLELAEQPVTMSGQPDVATPLPRQRRIGKMANRLPESLVIVAFGDRSRQLEPRDIDASDELAGFREASAVPGTTTRAAGGRSIETICSTCGFCGALIAPGMNAGDAVIHETDQAQREERRGSSTRAAWRARHRASLYASAPPARYARRVRTASF